MAEANNTILSETQENSEDENSDNNLKIVIESPRRKPACQLNENEKLIIQSVEENIEKGLNEKAAKTNLNVSNVKNIIKHVVRNEHFLALVRQAENPGECDETVTVYEPKLTRAKAKELLSSGPITQVPWSTPKQGTSEVHVLFREDLQEDSSGDEYVPGEEESEDDKENSIISDSEQLSITPTIPSTPPKNTDCSTQTNWTDDGVFKIPPSKTKEDEANIALRTRSKLCLSSTPLEEIEESFIPPDITTDMYDMDCDDDDWRDFLKKFTRPLDEITKCAEDEDHDPEYNILADEQIDQIDREELRMDKAVKVTRKELNNLMAELFEFANIYSSEEANTDAVVEQTSDLQQDSAKALTPEINVVAEATEVVDKEKEEILIEEFQIPLLEQQMRQHVQILTQNFLLTYQHPELHNQSIEIKEYLLNLKFLGEGKAASIFYAVNLPGALQLVNDWEILLSSQSEEAEKTKSYVEKVLAESIQRYKASLVYIVTFPPLLMETIAKSEVFLYTHLLPRIPFKSMRVFSDRNQKCNSYEDQLIAMGLEQFIPFARASKFNLTYTGDVRLKVVSELIQQYMMPHRDSRKLYYRIAAMRQERRDDNPIKYFFKNNKAPPVVHYIFPLDQLEILPPCKRRPAELPYQWKQFIFPEPKIVENPIQLITIQTLVPQVYNITDTNTFILPKNGPVAITPKYGKKKRGPYLKCKRKAKKTNTTLNDSEANDQRKNVTSIDKFVQCLNKSSPTRDILKLFPKNNSPGSGLFPIEGNITTSADMNSLPSMPNLGTPIKVIPQPTIEKPAIASKVVEVEDNITNSETSSVSSSKTIEISLSDLQDAGLSAQEVPVVVVSESTIANTSFLEKTSKATVQDDCVPSTSKANPCVEFIESEKDNLDDINALMIASSSMKPSTRKDQLSGAEKKRAKIRREFITNLLISTPEDPAVEKDKNERFAMAYYDKLREVLELEDYHKIMQILNDHEGDAVDLYKKVETVLMPKYEELADEFLLFLREREAATVGRLIPWIRMTSRAKFFRKLEIYFKDQPAQLRKIYKSLTELTQTVDVSMDKIKSTLLPMLKGNAILNDLFLQNFLDETPPPSLVEGPYETIDINKEMSRPDTDELFETITVPDTDDKYGGPNCICACHKIEDPEFKSRYRHCIPCGTRFIQGKVYIQTGRGLRPANISFLTSPNTDHNIRLNGKPSTTVTQRKKRSDTSPSKQVTTSPTKENADEETDEDADGKKKPKNKRTPRKRKKQPDKPKTPKDTSKVTSKKRAAMSCDNTKTDVNSAQKETKAATRKRNNPSRKTKGKDVEPKKEEVEENMQHVNNFEEKSPESKTGSTAGQEKRPAEDAEPDLMEWDCNASIESAELKPTSPGQNTAESESEFCEESSQDNCESDSNSSISSASNAHSQSDSNASEEPSWKREEDKIILQTFQRENDKENAFRIISKQLKNRSVSQIRNRFHTLMALLLEQVGER